MLSHLIKNQYLTIEINEYGAELTSILDHNTNTEYLWNGNPDYWKRQAPVLFPFVGLLKNKTYTYQDQTYPTAQHGFARDMIFQVISSSENELWLALVATKETREIYPFDFRLELGYRLEGHKLTCYWTVKNEGDTIMYFSIGGHPAFNCPLDPSEEQSEYYLSFDTENPIHYQHVNKDGYLNKKPYDKQNILTTDHGVLPIDSHLFDYDALVIEDNQCHQVSILDPAKSSYLTVSFAAPLFGLWSPAKKNAPFICIEPWYGRCDSSDFEGTLEEREYSNSLEPGKSFETYYTIEIA